MMNQFDILGIGVSVFDIAVVVDRLPEEETVVRARSVWEAPSPWQLPPPVLLAEESRLPTHLVRSRCRS